MKTLSSIRVSASRSGCELERSRCSWLWVVLLFAALARTVGAGTNGFVVPMFRGSVGSEVAVWETFAVASGGQGNPPQAGTGNPLLHQLDTNAFITGSGNIYNLKGRSEFLLTHVPGVSPGTVAIQTRTIGGEIDPETVVLLYTNRFGEQVLKPLYRLELSRMASQGFAVSTLWQWDTSGLGITGYTILFGAAGDSLSFDSMSLDVAPRFGEVFRGQPFLLRGQPAGVARWMYPFNGNPASRPTASVFGGLGSVPDFDSRDSQFFLGWGTTNQVPAGQGARNYLVRRARVTLTIATGNAYTYTGRLRDYRTYFPTNDTRHLPPGSEACPVELFGVGFRGGFTAATFGQEGPWGVVPNGYFTNRTAYAAGYDALGRLVDVSNNVGDDGTNEIAEPFEVAPFAVGQSSEVSEGELMPLGSRLVLDLNLKDPLILGYVQEALEAGHLALMASCLVRSGFNGPPRYPNFFTSFSPIATADQMPVLELEGTVIRPGVDGDLDGLPDDWENFNFGSLLHGAGDDPDGDGSSNALEYAAGTQPTSPQSRFWLSRPRAFPGGLELRFTPAAGLKHAVFESGDLMGWTEVVGEPVRFSSAWLSKEEPEATYPSPVYGVWRDARGLWSHRFYRIGAQR